MKLLRAVKLPLQERDDSVSVPLRVDEQCFALGPSNIALLKDGEVSDDMVASVVVRRDGVEPGT